MERAAALIGQGGAIATDQPGHLPDAAGRFLNHGFVPEHLILISALACPGNDRKLTRR